MLLPTILLLLTIKTSTASPKYSIIMVWARPSDVASGSDVGIATWQECVEYCYVTDTCVFVYFNSKSCFVFEQGDATSAEQLDSGSYGERIAFKIYSLSTCPSTIDNFSSAKGGHTSDSSPLTDYTHNLTYSNGVWNLTYDVVKSCPSSWSMFTRPSADVCLKLFGDVAQNYTYDAARVACESNSGTIAGLETQAERDFLLESASQLIGNDNSFKGGVWVSGKRSANCDTNATKDLPRCEGLNGFTFEDTYLTNKSGYQWATNQPDGKANSTSGEIQSCMMVHVARENTYYNYGRIDDAFCATGGVLSIMGYLCVRVAG